MVKGGHALWKFQKQDGNMRQQGGGRGVAHFSGEGREIREGWGRWRKGKGAALKYARDGKGCRGEVET